MVERKAGKAQGRAGNLYAALPGLARRSMQYFSPVAVLWLLTACGVTLLGLRFFMRAIGVRDDLPFPTFVYGSTAPLVSPFYRLFPTDSRFDYPAIEPASLMAAGVLVAISLAIYVLALVVNARNSNRGRPAPR